VAFVVKKSIMSYKTTFRNKVQNRLAKAIPSELLTETGISHLPPVIQQYLHLTGAVGRPKIQNLRAVFEGEMKLSEKAGWMKIRSVQYNFFDNPGRYFYITAGMAGIPVRGLHIFENGYATMQIKVAGLITVADAKGPEMDRGETVTVLNDMCFMAPASLANEGMKWEELDQYRVKVQWRNEGMKGNRNGGIEVSAVLEFNDKGEMINFVSEDRSKSLDGKIYEHLPWSTPISDYSERDGRTVPGYGEAVWHYADREFCYGRFKVSELNYNVSSFRF
jgi:hypothetical protein